MRWLLFASAVTVLASARLAAAQAPSASLAMEASPSVVPVGGVLRVTIRAEVRNGEAGAIVRPSFEDFELLGESASTPMQFRFGFGAQTRTLQATVVHTYTLRATRPGRYRFAPARMPFEGRTVASTAIEVEVTASGGGASLTPIDPDPSVSAPTSPAAPPAGSLDGASFDPRAFVRTVVDKARPFVGEQVTVTIYLYTRDGVRVAPSAAREPTTDGFWVHDLLPPQRSVTPVEQFVGGAPFRVIVLRRFAAFPLQAGPLTVGPMSVTIDTGSPFDIFGMNPPERLERTGVPVALEVQPLPTEGRPPHVSEVVGKFDLEVTLDRTELATGDAATLTATLRGSGNVRDARIATPRIDGLRVLEPELEEEITAPGDLVGGSKRFRWLVVPERPGRYPLEGIGLAAFDPSTRAWRTLTGPALTLTAVGAAAAPTAPSDVDTAAAPDPTDVGSPLTIRTRSDLRRRERPLAHAPWFTWLLLAPPIALGIVWMSRAARSRLAAQRRDRSSKRSPRAVRQALESAASHATRADSAATYAAAGNALKLAIELRLGEAIGGLTYEQLRPHLLRRGMAPDLVQRVVDELEGAEFARFSAAGSSPPELERCVARVEALVTRVQEFSPIVDGAPP